MDISELAMGDRVYHSVYGYGVVVFTTEKPSAQVRFNVGKVITFTDKNRMGLQFA